MLLSPAALVIFINDIMKQNSKVVMASLAALIHLLGKKQTKHVLSQ